MGMHDVEKWRERSILVREMLNILIERERAVLIGIYGLDGDEEKTLEQVEQEFGVTRERVRQIEEKALRKLRHPTRSKKLKDLLD